MPYTQNEKGWQHHGEKPPKSNHYDTPDPLVRGCTELYGDAYQKSLGPPPDPARQLALMVLDPEAPISGWLDKARIARLESLARQILEAQ